MQKENDNTMKKTEVYRAVLDIVCEECEICESSLLSGIRTADVVDARCILVQCLQEQGMYPTEIARFTGLATRSVHHILSHFDERLKFNFYFRNNYANVRQSIGKNLLLQS
jgi:hypothetical protein